MHVYSLIPSAHIHARLAYVCYIQARAKLHCIAVRCACGWATLNMTCAYFDVQRRCHYAFPHTIYMHAAPPETHRSLHILCIRSIGLALVCRLQHFYMFARRFVGYPFLVPIAAVGCNASRTTVQCFVPVYKFDSTLGNPHEGPVSNVTGNKMHLRV